MTTVRLEVQDHIAQITISRPEALNALSSQVLTDLEKALDQSLEEKARVIVLQGEGDKAFVAGADIKEIESLDAKGAYEFARRGQKLFRRLECLPLPSIAKVQGFALGGGMELALSADMIVASRQSQWGLPESTLGLLPGFGGTVRLSRRIGPQRAKQVALMGEVLSAQKAYEMGLVNEVVEHEKLDETALRWAGVLARRAPLALGSIKESINENSHLSVEEALEKEAQHFKELFNTADTQEGLRAFIEKRKPKFEGR